MSRLYYPPVRAAAMAGGGEKGGIDLGDAAKKILKLIPSEIVGGYSGLIGAAMAIGYAAARLWCFWIAFLLGLVLTPLYLNMVADPGKPKRNHLIVSTIAFPFWAYLVSGDRLIPDYYDPALAAFLALAYSFVAGAIPMKK